MSHRRGTHLSNFLQGVHPYTPKDILELAVDPIDLLDPFAVACWPTVSLPWALVAQTKTVAPAKWQGHSHGHFAPPSPTPLPSIRPKILLVHTCRACPSLVQSHGLHREHIKTTLHRQESRLPNPM